MANLATVHVFRRQRLRGRWVEVLGAVHRGRCESTANDLGLGDMYYEVRMDGPNRRHYRLFRVLEHDGERLGLGGPSIVAIVGMEKAFRTTFSERDYDRVRQLGEEYRSRVPRSVLR
jgi:hypothetical protein